MDHGFHVFNTHEPGVEAQQTSESAAQRCSFSPQRCRYRIFIFYKLTIILKHVHCKCTLAKQPDLLVDTVHQGHVQHLRLPVLLKKKHLNPFAELISSDMRRCEACDLRV